MEPVDRLWILSLLGAGLFVWWALSKAQELRDEELRTPLPEPPWR